MAFTSLTQADLPKLNEHLATRSYLGGFVATADDRVAYSHCSELNVCPEAFPHVARWLRHIASFTRAEREKFPGEPTVCKCGEKACEKAKPAGDAVDLFGSDSESDDEETKAEQARLRAAAEAKQGAKKKKQDMSMIVLHVKPIDDESDLVAVMKAIPTDIVFDGLRWGEAELQDICFGLKMIAIACTVVDDICSIDDVCEAIVEKYENSVQSCDIHSFNKLG